MCQLQAKVSLQLERERAQKREVAGGKPGTSMISTSQGKTEISLRSGTPEAVVRQNAAHHTKRFLSLRPKLLGLGRQADFPMGAN